MYVHIMLKLVIISKAKHCFIDLIVAILQFSLMNLKYLMVGELDERANNQGFTKFSIFYSQVTKNVFTKYIGQLYSTHLTK